MPDTPRYCAEVTGHFVRFFSRNPKTTTMRWHSRFKAEYHTLRDARAAKANYEASGRILWPDDLRGRDAKPEAALRSQANQQQEMRI
jgi:hypothetical protein